MSKKPLTDLQKIMLEILMENKTMSEPELIMLALERQVTLGGKCNV